MSDSNYSNDEARVKEADYDGQSYQGNPYPIDAQFNAAGTYYGGKPPRDYQGAPKAPRNNNYNGYRQANSNYGYQRNYGSDGQGNYRGDYRMNYPANYQGDYYCHPPYHHDHDEYYRDYPGHEDYRDHRYCGKYPPGAYGGYGRHNGPCCDPYYGQRNGSWSNWLNLSGFVQRPKVNNFLRGVGIATVGVILAPSIAKTLRPVIVKAVQGAMAASGEIKSIFSDAKEDIEDIFAEAKWDDARRNEGNNDNGTPND